MEEYVPYFLTGGVVVSTGILAVSAIKIYNKKKEDREKEERRRSYPRDTVILHQFPRGPYAPSLSPFAIKLETYLRMANIPYQNEFSMEFGPKGKFPWITFNGEDIADSQISIEFLSKKFNVDLNKNLSQEELATARAFYKMSEQSLLWSMAITRFVINEDNWAFLSRTTHVPVSFWNGINKLLTGQGHAQGLGRHDNDYIIKVGQDDIKALSYFIGSKQFLMGDEPCEIDCAIFGQLVQVLWQLPGSGQEKTIKACPNLVSYCERMKERYWPDWDQCNTAGGTKEATA